MAESTSEQKEAKPLLSSSGNVESSNEEEEDEQSITTYQQQPQSLERSVMDFSSNKIVEQRQGKPKHGMILFFHFVFKVIAFFLYTFSNVMGMKYTSTFVFVLLLLSMDFWIVKNLSGRLLAGFRWWNCVENSQISAKSVWKFESWTLEERQLAYKSQVHMFWTGIIVQQLMWSILLLSAIFSLKLGWSVITLIANALNGANLYGYIRCRWHRSDDANPGLFSRIRDLTANMFRTSGGNYSKGVAN